MNRRDELNLIKALLDAKIKELVALSEKLTELIREMPQSESESGPPTLGELKAKLKPFFDQGLLEDPRMQCGVAVVAKKEKKWLTPEQWQSVDAAVREMGGKWIAEKERSRWEVRVA